MADLNVSYRDAAGALITQPFGRTQPALLLRRLGPRAVVNTAPSRILQAEVRGEALWQPPYTSTLQRVSVAQATWPQNLPVRKAIYNPETDPYGVQVPVLQPVDAEVCVAPRRDLGKRIWGVGVQWVFEVTDAHPSRVPFAQGLQTRTFSSVEPSPDARDLPLGVGDVVAFHPSDQTLAAFVLGSGTLYARNPDRYAHVVTGWRVGMLVAA